MAKLDENLEIGNTSKKLKDIVDVYSTSETKTNKKWIDGKEIYRKVLQFSRTNDSQFSITLGTNINEITFIDAYVKGTNNLVHGLYRVNDGDQFRYYINFYANKVINVIPGGNFPTEPFTGYFIVEYTKTTD